MKLSENCAAELQRELGSNGNCAAKQSRELAARTKDIRVWLPIKRTGRASTRQASNCKLDLKQTISRKTSVWQSGPESRYKPHSMRATEFP